jgi:hypothetical protein
MAGTREILKSAATKILSRAVIGDILGETLLEKGVGSSTNHSTPEIIRQLQETLAEPCLDEIP